MVLVGHMLHILVVHGMALHLRWLRVRRYPWSIKYLWTFCLIHCVFLFVVLALVALFLCLVLLDYYNHHHHYYYYYLNISICICLLICHFLCGLSVAWHFTVSSFNHSQSFIPGNAGPFHGTKRNCIYTQCLFKYCSMVCTHLWYSGMIVGVQHFLYLWICLIH